ncbi:MAG: hypothetical protein L7T26_08220 [Pseudomonadales bacterium]|jgi:hypothetical protein|nr:hypothetical protein [Pseudomonadales bacterium]
MTAKLIGLMLILAPLHLSADAICRLGQLERKISVVYEQPPAQVPCQVRYVKTPEQEISFPWRAAREIGYCEARVKALAEKFQSLGWTCEDLASNEQPSAADGIPVSADTADPT